MTRTNKTGRRRARKSAAAARRQQRYGADDQAEYQLTQPLWVVELLLGVHERLAERESA